MFAGEPFIWQGCSKACCLVVAGTVAGVALPATEDALKIKFALDSLDCPDPFAHTTSVPGAVKDAIE